VGASVHLGGERHPGRHGADAAAAQPRRRRVRDDRSVRCRPGRRCDRADLPARAFPLPAAATPFNGASEEGTILFRAHDESEAIVLRNGQAEGLRITQNISATLTTAPIFTIYVRYIERAVTITVLLLVKGLH
jgi:hypothetical protein